MVTSAYLLTICPAGDTCSLVSLLGNEDTAEEQTLHTRQLGLLGKLSGPQTSPGLHPSSASALGLPVNPHPSSQLVLTVAVWKISVALGTGGTVLSREVGSAVTAAC